MERFEFGEWRGCYSVSPCGLVSWCVWKCDENAEIVAEDSGRVMLFDDYESPHDYLAAVCASVE